MYNNLPDNVRPADIDEHMSGRSIFSGRNTPEAGDHHDAVVSILTACNKDIIAAYAKALHSIEGLPDAGGGAVYKRSLAEVTSLLQMATRWTSHDYDIHPEGLIDLLPSREQVEAVVDHEVTSEVLAFRQTAKLAGFSPN